MVKAGQARIVRHETGRPDPDFSWSVGQSSIDESPGVAPAFGQEVREGIQVVVRRDGDGQQEGEKRERRRAAERHRQRGFPGDLLRHEAFESRDENTKTGADTDTLKSNQTAIRLETAADSKYLNLLNQGVSLWINHPLKYSSFGISLQEIE